MATNPINPYALGPILTLTFGGAALIWMIGRAIRHVMIGSSRGRLGGGLCSFLLGAVIGLPTARRDRMRPVLNGSFSQSFARGDFMPASPCSVRLFDSVR